MKAIAIIAVIAMGMVGLYHKVEYSGYVLFWGMISFLFCELGDKK